MATELSVETVRDFIVLNDGRVKNAALVAHFRKLLDDPNKKSDVRQKFKDCVNTVAVVKAEDGEKYVQLKKKFRTAAPVMSSSTTLEPADNHTARASPSHNLVSSFDSPIVPESEKLVLHRKTSPSIQGHPPPRNYHDGEAGVASHGRRPTEEVVPNQVDPIVTIPEHRKPPPSENTVYETPTVQMDSSGFFRVPLPTQDRKSVTETTRRSPQPAPSTSSVQQMRMNFQNNSEDTASLMPSEASLDSSKEQDYDESNTGNTFAVDPTEKEWMLMAARGNMLELRKLLNKDPNLAEKRDFVLGYTALHWGAKKGSEDLVRMFGDIGVDVNTMSNGGYTPMHLAAMHGHEKIVQILVEEYDGDPHIRNYSGKQARDYLRPGVVSSSIKKLLFANDGAPAVQDFPTGLRPRLDTVRKSKRLGSAISGGVGVLGALVRGKPTSNEDVSSISSASPGTGRKGSVGQKGKKKKNRKWSRDERPSINLISPNPDDLDFGFGSRASSNVPDGMRHGNSATPSSHRGSVS